MSAPIPINMLYTKKKKKKEFSSTFSKKEKKKKNWNTSFKGGYKKNILKGGDQKREKNSVQAKRKEMSTTPSFRKMQEYQLPFSGNISLFSSNET